MLPPDLEAVLFDAGGTLVHLDYVFIAEVAQCHGVDVAEEALFRAEAAARRALDAHAEGAGRVTGTDASRRPDYLGMLLHAAGVPEPATSAIIGDLQKASLASGLWRVPCTGAAEGVAALRAAGLRTAVVSNADGRIGEGLEALGFGGLFEVIVDSHWEGVEKPDPEIFRRALARLAVEPRRAAYIGDIYSIDVVGARAAGLAPVLVDPTGAYAGCDCATVAGVGELPRIWRRVAGGGE